MEEQKAAQTYLVPIDVMKQISGVLSALPYAQVAPLIARIQGESVAVTKTIQEMMSDDGGDSS